MLLLSKINLFPLKSAPVITFSLCNFLFAQNQCLLMDVVEN